MVTTEENILGIKIGFTNEKNCRSKNFQLINGNMLVCRKGVRADTAEIAEKYESLDEDHKNYMRSYFDNETDTYVSKSSEYYWVNVVVRISDITLVGEPINGLLNFHLFNTCECHVKGDITEYIVMKQIADDIYDKKQEKLQLMRIK